MKYFKVQCTHFSLKSPVCTVLLQIQVRNTDIVSKTLEVLFIVGAGQLIIMMSSSAYRMGTVLNQC